jgi:hypothetical protein
LRRNLESALPKYHIRQLALPLGSGSAANERRITGAESVARRAVALAPHLKQDPGSRFRQKEERIMDVVSRTLAAPIWYDNLRIYVPTVDIPQGEWTVLLTLTPILGGPSSDLSITALSPKVTGVDFAGSPVNLVVDHGGILENTLNLLHWSIDFAGKRLVLRFYNTVHSLEKGGQPLPAQYEIRIGGLLSSATHGVKSCSDGSKSFDPVIVAQPDPIYP